MAHRRRKEILVRAGINNRLIACGWRDDLKQHCIEFIKNKGIEKVTVDEIVAEIAPKGRANVPDSLKAEVLNRIRAFAEEQFGPPGS